ncbi:MAG TPA: hypothetical protein DD637_06410 [Verrucomicrobia bacterium]|nr:hypothetical protein [Verrucomicrobiota bacterium]
MIVSVLLGFAVLAALVLSGFFSGTEAAFVTVSRGRIVHLSREGSAKAKIVLRAIGDLQDTVTTILVGNNIANTLYSSASAALAARVFADSSLMCTVWACIAAFVVLYLGEFFPKLLCTTRPLERVLFLAPLYEAASILLRPLSGLATAVIGFFVPRAEVRPGVTTNDLLRILQDRKDGAVLTDLESALIARILVLRRKGEKVTAESLLSVLDDARLHTLKLEDL